MFCTIKDYIPKNIVLRKKTCVISSLAEYKVKPGVTFSSHDGASCTPLTACPGAPIPRWLTHPYWGLQIIVAHCNLHTFGRSWASFSARREPLIVGNRKSTGGAGRAALLKLFQPIETAETSFVNSKVQSLHCVVPYVTFEHHILLSEKKLKANRKCASFIGNPILVSM